MSDLATFRREYAASKQQQRREHLQKDGLCSWCGGFKEPERIDKSICLPCTIRDREVKRRRYHRNKAEKKSATAQTAIQEGNEFFSTS